MKAIFLIIAEGFRDEEYLVSKEIFIKNGIEVITASTVTGEVIGKKGLTTANVDLLFTEVDPVDYDILVIIGGGRNLWHNETVLELTKEFNIQNKLIGAICSSGVIPAQAGLLKGKRSTAFSDQLEITEITNNGAIYTGNSIEVEGNIITAKDVDTTQEFANKLIEMSKR